MKKKLIMVLSLIMIITGASSSVLAETSTSTKEIDVNLEPPSEYAVRAEYDPDGPGELEPEPIIPKAGGALYYKFKKTSQSLDQTSGKWVRVSQKFRYPLKATIEYQKTHSATYSATIASNNRSKIKATASVSCSYSMQNSKKTSVSYSPPKGYQGWIKFKPFYIKVTGKLSQYNSSFPNSPLSTTTVTARFIRPMGGYSDGLFDHGKEKI